MRYRIGLLVVMTAILAGPAGAGSTKFRSTWKAPEAAGLDLRGQKVATLIIRKDNGSRQDTENALARELIARGVQGIPLYSIVPVEELRNREAAKARLEKAGIVAVVAMREIDQAIDLHEGAATYFASGTYNTFWGYYDGGWAGVYAPSYVSMTRVISVETLVYDLRRDKLMWAGMSETTNPDTALKLIRDLAAAAAKEMKKQGLVRPRP